MSHPAQFGGRDAAVAFGTLGPPAAHRCLDLIPSRGARVKVGLVDKVVLDTDVEECKQDSEIRPRHVRNMNAGAIAGEVRRRGVARVHVDESATLAHPRKVLNERGHRHRDVRAQHEHSVGPRKVAERKSEAPVHPKGPVRGRRCR